VSAVEFGSGGPGVSPALSPVIDLGLAFSQQIRSTRRWKPARNIRSQPVQQRHMATNVRTP